MSLDTRLVALAQAVGADIGALITSRGVMANLTTTEKSSLVGAINEIKAAVAAVDLTDLVADGSVGTTTVWSSQKVQDSLTALKSEILAGAPEAFDTLKEISDYLASNTTAVDGVMTAIGNRVRYDAAQTLTAEQKLQACQNIGVGNPETDLVAAYAAAKVA